MSITTDTPILSTLSAKTAASPVGYRAYIDGLRAIAVLAVLCYHANIGCKGGFVGVDVFFVISGYLITGIILKDIDGGQFYILKFWERRVLRILPALAVVVLACLAIGWFVLLPIDFKTLANSVVAQTMLVSNVFFWRSSSYFGPIAGFQPLLHTWSLAVEEQFYLLFPLLLVAVYRFSRRYLIPAILLLCGISFCLSVYWSYNHADANFYLLPTRAWELGIGALLAIIPVQHTLKSWLAEALSWGGLLAILCAVFYYNSNTRFPGVTALLPCVGAFLVIWANGHSLTSVGKLLSVRPIVFVGLISYSLYLWHWPILVFSQYLSFDPLSVGLRMLLLVMSFALAVISWRFVETPFRKRIVLQRRSQIFTFAGITSVVLLLTGLSVSKLQGVPARIPTAALQYANGSTDRAFLDEVGLKEALAGDFIELGSGDKRRPIDVFVWGDSQGMAVMPVLDRLCKEYGVRGVGATHSGTCPLLGYQSNGRYTLGNESIAYNNAVVKFIRDKRISNVVLVGLWHSYVDHAGNYSQLHRDLLNTINTLKDTGARIWIMREIPQQHCDNVPEDLAIALMFHSGDPEKFGISLAEQREGSRKQNPIFDGLTTQYPSVTVLDPTDCFVRSDGICHVAKNGKSLYIDHTHLSVTGAMELRPLFAPLFAGIGKSPVSVSMLH